MNQEDLDELMTIKRATRMAAEEILFELEAAPSGTVITTRQQLQKALGPDGKATVDDLFDLHAALHLLAATHGLVLDASDRGGADVGLPFNLDYTVRHLPDVLANSHVANENPLAPRNWHDEYDEMIAGAIDAILAEALPTWAVPGRLRFSYRRLDVLDAEILSIHCPFKIVRSSFSLSFELKTNASIFQDRHQPRPEPTIMNLKLVCKGLDEPCARIWNPETREWDARNPI